MVTTKMCTDLVSAHYDNDEDKFNEIIRSIGSINDDIDSVIPLIIKAHKEHDNEKFALYSGVLASRLNGNNLTADVIMTAIAEEEDKRR